MVASHLFSRWFLPQVIFSTQNVEAICSSETSVDTQRTTRRYIPEGKPPAFTLVSFLVYSFDPEDGGDVSPKRRLTQRTTRRYIPEDDTIHNHRCESLKYYNTFLDPLNIISLNNAVKDPAVQGQSMNYKNSRRRHGKRTSWPILK
jgi:hypothetical protein